MPAEAQLGTDLDNVAAATDRLIATARRFDDAALREPSLCAGWTRGHVLAHVAGNADGLANLMEWARTGIEHPQYESQAARDAAIRRVAGDRPRSWWPTRSIRRSVSRPRRPPYRTTTGSCRSAASAARSRPARHFVGARLREVEIHHVDLNADYGPVDWPGAFAQGLLRHVVDGYADADDAPRLRVHASDLDEDYTIGGGGPTRVIGPAAELLAWLIGRSTGESLDVQPTGLRPTVPSRS